MRSTDNFNLVPKYIMTSLSESICPNDSSQPYQKVLLGFSLTVKAATLIFISGCGLSISYAKEGQLGCIYNLVKG